MEPEPPSAGRVPHGVFVGLSTLDIIQRVKEFPGRNAKATALRQDVAGGGPALNAAVVFSALGGRATLVTRLGHGSISTVVREDLEACSVALVDLADAGYQPSVSTITVDDTTGERRIVSTDALGGQRQLAQLLLPGEADVKAALDALGRADVVHLDGHHPDLALTAAGWGRKRGIPRVVDAGRWKDVMAELVPLATEVVCSADFAVPDGGGTLQWILDRGAELAAVTDGPAPVRWLSRQGGGSVDMEQFRAVDTLGAGDFFHGAYSFARTFGGAGRLEPAAALKFAGHIAALKCAWPGTREWLGGLAGSGPLDYLRTVRP